MKKEKVNSPSHYNDYDIEVIDMVIKLWGREKTIIFCKINAFKYRMRAGKKLIPVIEKRASGHEIVVSYYNNYDEDLQKERWYLDKAKELKKDELIDVRV